MVRQRTQSGFLKVKRMAIFNNNSERQGAQLPASSSLTRPQRSKTHDRPSRLLDLAGNLISLKRVSDYPIESQSEIGTKSECSVKVLKVKSTSHYRTFLTPSLNLKQGLTLANSEEILTKEAAHRLCNAQGLNPDLKRYEQRKTHQIRQKMAVGKNGRNMFMFRLAT